MKWMLTGTDGVRQTLVDRARSFLLHALFRTLYGSAARIYEPLTRIVFVGEWRRWQETALDGLAPESAIVELGCGPGNFGAAMSGRFGKWIGLDISQEMIRVAANHTTTPTLFFLRSDAGAMPLVSGAADAVLATFPSNYIYEPGVLDEIRRVLKPEGRFVVVMTGELDPVGPRRRFTRAITRVLQGDQGAAIDVASLPGFEGMAGHYEWRATDFGRALVFTGQPVSTPGDGYNRQSGGAVWPERARRPVPMDLSR
jgi:SAM-dependent methyltransferase